MGPIDSRYEPEMLTHVRFSADGRRILLKMHNGDFARWDVGTGRSLPQLAASQGKEDSQLRRVLTCFDLPGGRVSVVPCSDGVVQVWDTVTGEQRSVPGRYADPLQGCQSPDGRLLALGDYTGRIEIWDVASGELLRTVRESGETVKGMAFSSDGAKLAYGVNRWPSNLSSGTTSVRVVSVADGRELWAVPPPVRSGVPGEAPLSGNAGAPYCFTDGDTKLVLNYSATSSSPHRVWDVSTNQAVKQFQPPSDGFNRAVSADGRTLVRSVEVNRSPVAVIGEDVYTGRQLWKWNLPVQKGTAWEVPGPVSIDGRIVVAWDYPAQSTASDAKRVTVYDAARGEVVSRFDIYPPGRPGRGSISQPNLSPDGSRFLLFVTSDKLKMLRVWDATTGRLLVDHDLDTQDIPRDVWFSPDGKSIFTIGPNGGCCYRWDVEKLIAEQKK